MFGMRPQELLIILLIIVVLFGAKKLPQVARGMGQSLRIFKSETKSLGDDNDDTDEKTDNHADEEVRAIEAPGSAPPQSQAEPHSGTQAEPQTGTPSTVRDSHGRDA